MASPRLSKGARTREKIVEAAIELFAKSGFASTSIQSIADRCGLTQTAVLYHFATKEDVVREVMGTVTRRNHELISAKLRPTDHAFERLLKHFEGNLEWTLKSPGAAQVSLLSYYLACFDPRFAEAHREAIAVGRLRIAEHLHAGKREGLFTFKEHVDSLAETLHDLLLGACVHQLSLNASRAPATRGAALRQVTRRWKRFLALACGYRAGA